MYFCQDVDLMVWEPGIFGEAAFAHQALVKEAAATLTGTALVTGAAVLGAVVPGMVARIDSADGTVAQLMEVVAVTDASHAVVSALRGRAEEAALPGYFGGSVKVTVASFRPQIAAAGDDLLAMLGAESDRDEAPGQALSEARGLRLAAVFGTLAAVFRTLSTGAEATAAMTAKLSFYEKCRETMRRRIEARVDRQTRRGGVGELVRR